jgi:hypothetical protein
MKVIHTKTELRKLEFDTDIIMIPIMSSNFLHTVSDKISLLYLFNQDLKDEYVFVFNHQEYHSSITAQDLPKFNNIYTLDKKQLIQLDIKADNIINCNLKDINLLTTPAHNFYNRKYYNYSKTNQLIPVYKHYEIFKKIKNRINKKIGTCSVNEFYNDLVLDNLARIEQNGLFVDRKLFINKYGLDSKKYISKDDLVYTQYNINTATNRPSNRFGGINYAALNSKDCTRKVFQSRFKNKGVLLEFDYSSYHLYLVASLINYKFPENMTAHEFLATKYFKTDSPTKEQIAEGKTFSFRLMYGHMIEEYKNIEFFQKVESFISGLWEDYNINHYIELPLSEKRITDVDTRDKLFNYYIQGYETERNAVITKTLLDLLVGHKSKLILYVYDAFVIDYCMDDGKKLIKEIKKVISSKEFPARIKYGVNYKDLKQLK